MKKVIPKKKTEQSAVSRLIAECRWALRNRVTDRSKVDLILQALDAAHAKFTAKYNKQKPDWNEQGKGDPQVKAAAILFRVCIFALRLRMAILRESEAGNGQTGTALLHGLRELREVAHYSLLTLECLVDDPAGSTEGDAKILSFERTTHQVSVDAYCAFLLDLKEQCPISVDCLQDWAADVPFKKSIGHSFRKEREYAGHMLVQLSHFNRNQFCGSCSPEDRTAVSEALLQSNESTTTLCGSWGWFSAEAACEGRELLRDVGFEVESPLPDEGVEQTLHSENATVECELQNLQGLHDQLRRDIPDCQEATIYSHLRDAVGIDLSRLGNDIQQLTVRDVVSSSFPQLKARCGKSVEAVRLVVAAARRLMAIASPQKVESGVEDARPQIGGGGLHFPKGLQSIEENRRLRDQAASPERRIRECPEALGAPLPNERIRAVWKGQFHDVSEDAAVVDALSWAIHPWPDTDLPNDLLLEVAAELLPVSNLNHHNLFQVCADRLWRIAEVFDSNHCVDLERKYSAAADTLAHEGTIRNVPLSARVWSQPAGLLTLSPTGLGGRLCERDSQHTDSQEEAKPMERLEETLTHIAGVAAANDTSDLGRIGGGEPTGVTVDQLADRMGVTLPIRAFDSYLTNLESRNRGVLIQRKLTMQVRSTLDEVGNKWGVTRERIRQIESKAFSAIDRLFRTRFKTLGNPVFKEAVKNIIPTDELHALAASVCGSSRWPDAAAAFMLYALGPWTGTSGWSVHVSLQNRLDSLPSKFTAIADPHGLIEDQAVEEICAGLFRNNAEQEVYLKSCVGLGFVCGRWTIKNTNRCRIVAALVHIGEPATKEEVAALADVTPDQAGSTLRAIEGIVRADRYRWGFSSWIDDEYDGIAGEIIQRIEEYGGVVRASLLLTEIPELFGVTENSVKAYLSSPAFTVHDGLVRRADADDYSPSDPRTVKDAVLLDGTWGHRLRLYQRHFEGYSLGVSFDIAYANGIRPDDSFRVPVTKSQYEASVIWRLQTLNQTVDVGRVAEFLRTSDFQPDDEVVVIATPQFVDIRRASDLAVQATEEEFTDETNSLPINDPLLDMLSGDL